MNDLNGIRGLFFGVLIGSAIWAVSIWAIWLWAR